LTNDINTNAKRKPKKNGTSNLKPIVANLVRLAFMVHLHCNYGKDKLFIQPTQRINRAKSRLGVEKMIRML
jgi:hypothetical protein